MNVFAIFIVILGITLTIEGYLAFTRPNSIFAKFVITLFKIDHRIKGITAIALGIFIMIIGTLYYFQ